MSVHAFLLAVTIATLMGSAFHILRGGSIRKLGLHLLAANLSFLLGQLLSELIAWRLIRVGALNLFPAILATILGLFLTTVLATDDVELSGRSRKPRKRR